MYIRKAQQQRHRPFSICDGRSRGDREWGCWWGDVIQLGLIPGQPGVQRLPRHPYFRGGLRDRQAIADHRQYSLIPLLSHAQLPHSGSVKDQPKQLSRISRNTVIHQPKAKSHTSPDVIQPVSGAGGARTRDQWIMSPKVNLHSKPWNARCELLTGPRSISEQRIFRRSGVYRAAEANGPGRHVDEGLLTRC